MLNGSNRFPPASEMFTYLKTMAIFFLKLIILIQESTGMGMSQEAILDNYGLACLFPFYQIAAFILAKLNNSSAIYPLHCTQVSATP